MKPDFHQLRTLWSDIFGDSDEYLDIFFTTYYNRAIILTEEHSGRIVAALWGIPFHFTGGLLGLYLCGLATRPEWRGRGIMSALIRQAEEWAYRNKFDFSFLIPADDDLRRYYSAMGYIDANSRTLWTLSYPLSISNDICGVENLMAVESESDCASDEPRIIHRKEDWKAVIRESYISGGKILCSHICDSDGKRIVDAVAFTEKTADGNRMRIVKVIGDTAASEKLLGEIGAKKGIDEPYGMWKPLSSAASDIKAPDFFLLLD